MANSLFDSKCIVIKIGSSLLVDNDKQCINQSWLASLIADVTELAAQEIKIILVSSGAIGLGKLTLKLKRKALPLDKTQAAAAVGQIQLLQLYQTLLNEKGLTTAQVLLSLSDTEHRRRYINLHNTLRQLLHLKVIPIINENDSVATDEIRYGDNDRLAARVAQMVQADTLVLLSDIDGLYTADPRINANAERLTVINELTNDIMQMAKDSGTDYGSGGMVTKLMAAKIAMDNGCRMLISNGKLQHPLQKYEQHRIGTWFLPQMNSMRAKKHWLQAHLHAVGKITIDAGAVNAIKKGASLLAVGIVAAQGNFSKGDAVDIVSVEQKIIARGLSNYSQLDLHKIIGKSNAELREILGYTGCDEVIHRDNLVVLIKA